jgi:hypothetical protein
MLFLLQSEDVQRLVYRGRLGVSKGGREGTEAADRQRLLPPQRNSLKHLKEDFLLCE